MFGKCGPRMSAHRAKFGIGNADRRVKINEAMYWNDRGQFVQAFLATGHTYAEAVKAWNGLHPDRRIGK